jgi:uncharacterized peroxidase-related enzyme
MSRIHTPASVDLSPEASRARLGAVQKSLGTVPNLFRLVGNSPTALRGYLEISAAVSASSLGVQSAERIALAVAESNGCDYCLAAHSYLGRHVAKLDDTEMTANRNGTSNDIEAAAAVRFAKQVVEARGHVSDAQLEAVKSAGYEDAAIVEIVLAVALNIFTNYINEVANTEIDFPVVEPQRLAA